MSFAERVKSARLAAKLSQKKLAEASGLSQGTIAQIENGRNKGSTEIIALARALCVDANWLDTGKSALRSQATRSVDGAHSDYSSVKRVKFKLSAGISGYEVEYLNGSRAPIFFRNDWLNERNLNAENLFAVEISGSSMEPSLFAGDLVVVNTANQQPVDGDVFALNYEGELVIKRMVRDRGEWLLSSDNQDKCRFPTKRCDERTSVVGKIVHKQSERI